MVAPCFPVVGVKIVGEIEPSVPKVAADHYLLSIDCLAFCQGPSMEDPTDGESKKKRGKAIHQSSGSTATADCDSVHPAARLPEIIGEILIKLPIKSLLQFKCVCKSWCALISNQIFAKAHLRASIRYKNYDNHRLIMSSVYPQSDVKTCTFSAALRGEIFTTRSLDYPLLHPHRPVRIVGSVNGLVGVVIDRSSVFLWNPTTRKSRRLPHCGRTIGQYIASGFYCRNITYGFGYVEATSDYKVVVINHLVTDDGPSRVEVRMYGLKSDSWKDLGDFPIGIPLDDSGKFVSGSLHWAVNIGFWNIVSFDLSKETYSEIAQPCYGEGVCDIDLGVLSGRLCVVCNICCIKADVWVMREYGKVKSWSKLFSMPYLNYPRQNFQYFSPLFVSNGGDIVFFVFGFGLMLYNLESGLFRHPVVQNFNNCFEADTYIESLIWPYPE